MSTIHRVTRQFPIAIAVLIGIGTMSLWGAEWRAFDNSAFKNAQAAGKTVVIDFHATWCPTCAKQKPILEKLISENEFQGVVAFVADYDSSSELKKQMKITGQSTIVVFKGDREVARSMGVTAESELRSLLKKGL